MSDAPWFVPEWERQAEEDTMNGEPIQCVQVHYDKRARDGTWCCLKPTCMNFPKCPESRPDFEELDGRYDWYVIIEEFDISSWEAKQRLKHPEWTVRQLRNPRHWQKGVVKKLREATHYWFNQLDAEIMLDIPEASGVNLVRTMADIGITLEWGTTARTIRKIMMIGKRHER